VFHRGLPFRLFLHGGVIKVKSTIVEKCKQSLLSKVSKRKKKPKLDWVGGLKEYRDQYTALELEKKR
jgi:hypothetical protein